MSHGTGLRKSESAAEKVRVLVSMDTPVPSKAMAPRGKGQVMISTMVGRKIASNCHVLYMPLKGTRMNQSIILVTIDASNGFIVVPCHDGDIRARSVKEMLVTLVVALTVNLLVFLGIGNEKGKWICQCIRKEVSAEGVEISGFEGSRVKGKEGAMG